MELCGAGGNDILRIQFPKEPVDQGDSFSGFHYCQVLAHNVGNVAGEDVGGLARFDISKGRGKVGFVFQETLKRIRHQ